MLIKWNKLIAIVIFWLATECLFNFLAIDDLADYSEFLFERNLTVLTNIS